MFREATIVTYKNRLIDISKGDSSSVEFDFENIWNEVKKIPEFENKYLNFFHTHAFNFDSYSETDIRCMKALNLGFGCSVNFWILALGRCFKHYRFVDGGVEHIKTIGGLKDLNLFDDVFVGGYSLTQINFILSYLSGYSQYETDN